MLELKVIREDFSVYKLGDLTQVDLTEEHYFIGKTDEELSLVCRTCRVPGNAVSGENDWKASRIQGVLGFSLIGIPARISSILAGEKIDVFVVSTYNTDYVLTREINFDRAFKALGARGYAIKDSQEEDDKTLDQSCLQA